ncbi:MAG: hypothetical protein ACWGO1_03070, partial [Anaerolineales bacterium]
MAQLRQFLIRVTAGVVWLSASLVYIPVKQADTPHRIFLPAIQTASQGSALAIAEISDNRTDYSGEQIPKFEKLEITFQVENTIAGNFQLPYDPSPPNGIDPSYLKHSGITVDALFLPPGEMDWIKAVRQPAFYYQYFDDQVRMSWDGNNHEWQHPTGNFAWKARFSPHLPGVWQYRLAAQDEGGSAVSSPVPFTVVDSDNPGFVRVSKEDPRYFEFDNGEMFHALGFEGVWGGFDDPILANEPNYKTYAQNGINLLRIWISGMYGTSWLAWLGGRNIYDGYLPRAGTEAFHDPLRDQDSLTLVLDYETQGDTGWYDACRFQFWNDPEAVKPHTNYRLQVTYWGEGISGPRDTKYPNYGLVGKVGGVWDVDCYQPGTSHVVTDYGGNTSDWKTLQGTWNSGDNYFLPRIYLGLENVVQGKVYLHSISLREELGNGRLGPEMLNEPSMEYDLYFPEQSAYAMDKIIQLAEEYGVYLKLVIMEKNDSIYYKLDDDGSFVLNGEEDNEDGFYGHGRAENKTRWLQKAWWRYLQARWGYSTAIHSWEATNEGDPWLEAHYQLTDEMGKFFHCEVFGVSVAQGDEQSCSYDHPNSHMVTTSFWHSFPAEQFWKNGSYPNIDYADLHAYISTSAIGVPPAELEKMQWDAAYYHTGHSQIIGGWDIGKPVVRGEAGIDSVDLQAEQPDLALDHNGVWLHNYLWSTLDAGGLVELYWWGDNRETQSGPDGGPGLHEIYRYFHDFIQDISLNSGSYRD